MDEIRKQIIKNKQEKVYLMRRLADLEFEISELEYQLETSLVIDKELINGPTTPTVTHAELLNDLNENEKYAIIGKGVKYHKLDCLNLNNVTNKLIHLYSKEFFEDKGFKPCKTCRP